MILNLEKGYVSVDDVNISISKLNKAGLIDVDFRNIDITFVYLEDEDYFFMYSDTAAYAELIKAIAEDREAMRRKLLLYMNDFGVGHFLWKQLMHYACKKFDLSVYLYMDEFSEEEYGLDPMSGYFDYTYGKRRYPRKVDSIEKAYDMLNSVLPQNFSETRRRYLKQEAEKSLKGFMDICGNDLENKECYLEKLETLNGSSVDKWNDSKGELQALRAKIQELTQEGIFDVQRSEYIQMFFEYCIGYVCRRVDKLNESALFQQYGPISELKIKLRESINKLGFMELLDLYKEYKEKEKLLCSKARHTGMELDKFPYKEYIDIYRLGSILISDKMNQINKNKAKNKYIPQNLLDEALIFYYDTESAKDAYSARSNEKYAQDKQSGNKKLNMP